MTAVPNRALAEAERKLTLLLMEVRGTAPFEQVKLYVAKFTNGRLLSEYLHDDSVPPKERAALATALIEILLTKDYSRLPALDSGAGAKPIPTGTPTPQLPVDRGAVAPAEPIRTAPPAGEDEEAQPPLSDEMRALVRSEVRRELANVMETIAKVLREAK